MNKDIKRVKSIKYRASSFLKLFNGRKWAKSGQILSLVPNRMADVNNRNVIDEAELATTEQLRNSSVHSAADWRALLPVCRVLGVPFQELCEPLEVSGNDISGCARPVISDPPYEMRCVYEQDNAKFERLLVGDMKNLVDLLTQVMHLGIQSHMSCSDSQFHSWTKLLHGKLKVLNTIDDDTEKIDTWEEKHLTFRVKQPLHYVRVQRCTARNTFKTS